MYSRRKSLLNSVTVATLMLVQIVAVAADSPPRGRSDFASMKQEMADRLRKELACVEAAKDENALRACRPRPPQGGPGGGGPPPDDNQRSGGSSNNYRLPDF